MEYAILAALVAGVWALLLWLSIIVWVYRDIRDRTRDLGLQVLAVFIVMMFFPGFNIPGLALYLMLRPRETLEEAYARSLEEEALLREIGDEGICPSCRRFTERGWRVCPFCQTQLKDVCSQCEQLLSFSWVSCPFCGTQRRAVAAAAPPPASEALQQAASAAAAPRRAGTKASTASSESPEQGPGRGSGTKRSATTEGPGEEVAPPTAAT